MKKTNLDPEEKQIIKDYEEGKFISLPDVGEEKKLLKEAAKNTLRKTKNINIRLTFKDLQLIKERAMNNGLPYQTLISSVLHQFAHDKIKILL